MGLTPESPVGRNVTICKCLGVFCLVFFWVKWFLGLCVVWVFLGFFYGGGLFVFIRIEVFI